jgi:hypothetical protein
MRARESGQRMPLGGTWEHRPQGGKYLFWNGKVLTARLQIDSRSWQWPLKGVDEEKARALMGSVRVARENLKRAADETRKHALGTDKALAAAAEYKSAHAQLAKAIITAGGPKELTEFVMRGPQEEINTAVSQPVVIRRPERRAIKKAALENCVQRYIALIWAYPDGAPEPRDTLAREMMNEFHVTWQEARDSRREAIKRTGNSTWRQHGRPSRR